MYFRHRSNRLSATLCLILSLLIAFPPTLLAQSGVHPTPDSAQNGAAPDLTQYLAARTRMDKLFVLLAQARSQLNRSTFDPEALLDELDYEAQDIIDYVKNQIRFEQYAGLLRGPVGTLMNRGGNALDQSVLLAKLLNDAGFETRIAAGKLSDKQVKLIFHSALSTPPPDFQPPVSDNFIATMRELNSIMDTPNEKLQKAIEALRAPPGVKNSDDMIAVTATTDFIESRMNEAIPGFSRPAPQPQIVKEAQQYYWAQYREVPSQPWQDIHAVLPGSISFSTPVSVQSYIADEVPEELQHRVSFSAKIEQRVGGKLVVHKLMSPWQRPAANMLGIPISYSNHPDSLNSSGDYLDVLGSLAKAQLFFPTFNGSLASGGQAFDDKGQLIDPMVAGNQAAGVFKTVGGAFGDVSAALGGDEQTMQLTRHWLEFTFVSPDGGEHVIKRTLYDIQIDGELDTVSLATKLAREHTFMVSTGEMAGDYALDQILRRIESSQQILQAVQERSFFLQKPIQLTVKQLEQVDSQWWGHYLLYPSFATQQKLGTASQLYISAPQLVMYSEDPPIGEGQRRVIDIVRNERRAIQLVDSVLYNAPRDTVLAGVWDTAMEGWVLSEEGRRSLNTFIALEGITNDDAKVFFPKDAFTVAELGLEKQALENIQADLARGYAIIVPDISPEMIKAWWRVDPATGNTLGMLYTGGGSDFTEALSLISGVISFGFWLNGTAGCVADGLSNSGSDTEFSCCMAVNSAFWVGGAVVGAFVGAAGVLASIGAFAGDMAYNMATAQLDLCSSN